MNDDLGHIIHSDDFCKIIAILFEDQIIRFGEEALNLLKKEGKYMALISIAEFRYLGRFGFGGKWSKYAQYAPCIFMLNKDTPSEIRRPYIDIHEWV